MPKAQSFEILGLDTETTGVGIFDSPVGVSLSDGRKDTTYYSFAHEGGENTHTLKQTVGAVRSIPEDVVIAMHGATFDMRMLLALGLPLLSDKHVVLDTMHMAAILNPYEPSYDLGALAKKHLGEEGKPDDELNEKCAEAFGGRPVRKAKSKGVEVGQAQNYWRAPASWVQEYAEWDAWATARLARVLYDKIVDQGLTEVLELEQALLPIMIRMKMAGVRVDVAAAEEHYARIRTELHRYHEEWGRAFPEVPLSGTGSKTKLLEAWEAAGLPFEKTKKGNRSIPKTLVTEYADKADIARLLSEIRPREKFSTTFLKGYIIDAHDEGRIYPNFHQLRGSYGGTVSGRFSSSGPNLQNPPSPKRDNPEWPESRQYGHLFRSMFLPDEGKEWLSADYSQIEYRFFAHYAGGQVREAFNSDPDIDFHQWCADIAGVTRSEAKNGNFAKLYGAGTKRLADTLGISQEAAKKFTVEYDAAIPEAASLFKRAVLKAERRGYIITWAGRRSVFLYRRGRYIKTHAALNYLLQGSAADLMKKAMIAVDEAIDWDECVMHLTVHDELNFSHPQGSRWPGVIREAMEDFELTVPILTDVEVGPNWGHLEAA